MDSTRQATERPCGDCDRTGEFCVSFASGSALRRDRQGRPPINQRRTFLPIGEHVGATRDERHGRRIEALDPGRRKLLTASSYSSSSFLCEEGAPSKVTRIPRRHFPEVLVRVTRASSIRCLVSVQTHSREGIEHGIHERSDDIRIRADGQQRPRFHHDGERLVLRRIWQWSRFDGCRRLAASEAQTHCWQRRTTTAEAQDAAISPL